MTLAPFIIAGTIFMTATAPLLDMLDPAPTIEAECGRTSTFMVGHRVISAVTHEQAEDDGFESHEVSYHIARYKAYYRRNITCLRDECPSPWSFDCVPTSNFVPSPGLGHATPGGYVYSWSDATVTRGCTVCTGL